MSSGPVRSQCTGVSCWSVKDHGPRFRTGSMFMIDQCLVNVCSVLVRIVVLLMFMRLMFGKMIWETDRHSCTVISLYYFVVRFLFVSRNPRYRDSGGCGTTGKKTELCSGLWGEISGVKSGELDRYFNTILRMSQILQGFSYVTLDVIIRTISSLLFGKIDRSNLLRFQKTTF